jgi:hypothetical protein
MLAIILVCNCVLFLSSCLIYLPDFIFQIRSCDLHVCFYYTRTLNLNRGWIWTWNLKRHSDKATGTCAQDINRTSSVVPPCQHRKRNTSLTFVLRAHGASYSREQPFLLSSSRAIYLTFLEALRRPALPLRTMAANNYYHNDYLNAQRPSYNTGEYHDHDNRNETPLPPLPYNSSPSPSPTPLVDPYGQPSAAPSSRYDTDPYDDRSAIPLDERGNKHGSMHSIAPILPPQHPDDDPFVRDAKPGKKRRRRSDGRGDRVDEDEGWFKGKITWVCFFMSSVQLAVFLAELIKYGKSLGFWLLVRAIKDMTNEYHRHAHGNANSTQTLLQSHDRTFALSLHQYGRSISALHAQHERRAERKELATVLALS